MQCYNIKFCIFCDVYVIYVIDLPVCDFAESFCKRVFLLRRSLYSLAAKKPARPTVRFMLWAVCLSVMQTPTPSNFVITEKKSTYVNAVLFVHLLQRGTNCKMQQFNLQLL